MYLLGFDLGSSSVKGALVDAQTGAIRCTLHYPETEMAIAAPHPGFAEQNPADWWENIKVLTHRLLQQSGAKGSDIKAIGISYQMHGLVALDAQGHPLRASIIWCDSRAVAIGEEADRALGQQYCLDHYLNAPGNFTASKLAWVRQNEPALFERIHKVMLPGDYIAYRMSGAMQTTVSGLSEGIFYDFKEKTPAHALLQHYGIPSGMLADVVPTVGQQATLHAQAAEELGLAAGTPIGYRAGDQPNNAMSLNVLKAGEVAATGGTSGVIYAVSDRPVYDPQSRVNSFAHVNYTPETPYTGVLLCINGAGIQYRWARTIAADAGMSYTAMEQEAAQVPVGAQGLVMLPFGNGAERMLGNRNPGGGMFGIDFNVHGRAHLYRAALEGIAFAFVHGAQILQKNNIDLHTMKVSSGNLFESTIFSQTIATLTQSRIQLMEANGAAGAARAAGVAIGSFGSLGEAMQSQSVVREFVPDGNTDAYQAAYSKWRAAL
jgi:xylulokinase